MQQQQHATFTRFTAHRINQRFIVVDRGRVDKVGNYKVVATWGTLAEAERSAAARQRSYETRVELKGW